MRPKISKVRAGSGTVHMAAGWGTGPRGRFKSRLVRGKWKGGRTFVGMGVSRLCNVRHARICYSPGYICQMARMYARSTLHMRRAYACSDPSATLRTWYDHEYSIASLAVV